jgi:hypothetical protein
MRFEGGDSRAPRHLIRAPREVIHALQGRRSTRSEGAERFTRTEKEGDSRASKGCDSRAPREVIHALRGSP